MVLRLSVGMFKWIKIHKALRTVPGTQEVLEGSVITASRGYGEDGTALLLQSPYAESWLALSEPSINMSSIIWCLVNKFNAPLCAP